ncbi:MAG: transglutaminase domain-containing protein [Planctomycetota bacterium]
MVRRVVVTSSLLGLLSAGVVAQSLTPAMRAAAARAGARVAEFEAGFADLDAPGRAAYAFLLRHMPATDLAALAPGLLIENVELAQTARASVPWGRGLSDALFHNYVVPYAQADETRESWRPQMVEDFLPLVAGCRTPGEAAQALNRQIFNLVDVHYSTGRKRALASPSESIAQHKATCTGLSILLADACRACCVPARLVSVRWPHKAGNHTWVEVWDGARWRFCGADEPDPKGLDRAWFVGDAQQCADADREHRAWAVSFAETGERFVPGWGRRPLWGVDVTQRYAPKPSAGGAVSGADALLAQMARYYAADEARRGAFEFDLNLDAELRTEAGDARLRALAWRALQAHERPLLQPNHDARVARAGAAALSYFIEPVGAQAAVGRPLVIAMHGAGAPDEALRDAQQRYLQSYRRDHSERPGYLYCALRAPSDAGAFVPLLEQTVRQLLVCEPVDPNRVVAIGFGVGGERACEQARTLPHRFAAIHRCVDGDSIGEPAAGAALPDRDHLADLLGAVRDPSPERLSWRAPSGAVRDHYWLRAVDAPAGARFELTLEDGVLRLGASARAAMELLLDARWVDLSRPLRVEGATADLPAAPSLRTLCRTMAERGDPALAASWIVRFGEVR